MKHPNLRLLLLSCLLGFWFCVSGQNYYEEGYQQYFYGHNDTLSVELFSRAIENNQEVAKAYMMRGAAKTYLGDPWGALFDLKKSISMDSTHFKVYFYMGRLYDVLGFYTMAIEQYTIAVKKNPEDPVSYDYRAMTEIKSGDYKEAIADEGIAIALDSLKAEYYNNRGFARYSMQRYEEAMKDYETAQKKGNPPGIHANKGLALAALGKHNEAIVEFTTGLTNNPKAPDINYYRGLSYKALGKKDLACWDFTKSVKMGYEPALAEQLKNCTHH